MYSVWIRHLGDILTWKLHSSSWDRFGTVWNKDWALWGSKVHRAVHALPEYKVHKPQRREVQWRERRLFL